MKQSKVMSLVESVVNILVGLGVAMAANAIILPMFGFDISFKQNLIFGVAMTVVSIVRSYGLRRLFEALHIRRPLSPFVQAVIAERFRQIEGEGYEPQHDDQHEGGELARAGAAYALYAPSHTSENKSRGVFALAISAWPWRKEDWKPTGFRRDLVKAGALVIAEGERFDRQRKQKRSPQS